MVEQQPTSIDIIKIVFTLVAGFAAGFWAFYKFYYLERKQEKEKTSYLLLNSTIKKIGNKDSFNVVQFTVDIINESSTKMYVLADYVNIYGISMVSNIISEEDYLQKATEKIANKDYAFLHRFVKLKEKKIVFSGKGFNYGDYWWLEPKERLVVNRIAYIPNTFDYAELVLTIYYSMNKDWIDVKTYPIDNEKGLCHEAVITLKEFKGEKFDWHNKKHVQLHSKYRNAEITHSSLLFVK